jgi:hypothetical protein
MDITAKYNSDDNSVNLTSDDKNQLRSLKQTHNTVIHETRAHINKCMDVLLSNDLRGALEVYSGKAVSMKFNARMQDIALRNQEKKLVGVDDQTVAAYIEGETRPLAQCINWLQNPLKCEKKEYASVDRGEWVGNGLLALPCKSAALSPWNINSVQLRSVVITNSSVATLQASPNDPRNKAILKGFEGEFNCSMPLLLPEEHQGAVRLAIEFMRKTHPGRQQVSRIFTNTPDLFNPAMINALYVTATLHTLQEASAGIDFTLAFRSLLTLADQLHTKSPIHNPDYAFWEKILDRMLCKDEKKTDTKLVDENTPLTGIRMIASKEPQNLPQISRAFLSLTCCDKAYSTDFSEIKRLFRLLFARLVVEETSQKYSFAKLVGVEEDDICPLSSLTLSLLRPVVKSRCRRWKWARIARTSSYIGRNWPSCSTSTARLGATWRRVSRSSQSSYTTFSMNESASMLAKRCYKLLTLIPKGAYTISLAHCMKGMIPSVLLDSW